jgi:hypothetical protein
MSDTGYFVRNKPELKMPRPGPVTGADNLGIRYEGSVLTGLLGVKQQLERQAANSPQTGAQIREIAPGGVTYVNPHSPIHYYHGVPIDSDPVYAAQRACLGGSPGSTDPVLRHHLNLPPLPDPYEERHRAAEAWQKERHKHVSR